MPCSWCLNFVKKPPLVSKFWWALLPVAIACTIGHVAAIVSMSEVDVSFVHIIKSSKPVFSVLSSRSVLGEAFRAPGLPLPSVIGVDAQSLFFQSSLLYVAR